MKSQYLREEYIARINRVIDFINQNIDKNLALEELARVASFSPFHFHRIFSALMGETLNQFIQRLRIERAADRLINNPKKSITEIALDCGFSGSATFARTFKEVYNMSASEWREGGYRKICKANHNTSQTVSNIRKAFEVSSMYIDPETNNPTWRIQMKETTSMQANVEVKEIPEMHVAYVRHIGPYQGDEALFERLFTKLFTWAGPRGLIQFPETKVISLYHDNPEITDENKLRIDVCITVSENTKVDGEIGKATIPGGKYAIAHFELKDSSQYGAAWNAIYGGWLPESGYQPDDRPCFEHCLNNPKEDPEGKHIVDIYVAVKPL